MLYSPNCYYLASSGYLNTDYWLNLLPAAGRPAGSASAFINGRQLPPEHDHHRGGREAGPRHRNGPRRRYSGHQDVAARTSSDLLYKNLF